MEDKKKIAIGAGIASAIGAIIYFATRAKALPPPPPGTATLYGIVTDDETGEPILDVLVMLNGGSTYTDGTGAYTFADIASGEYMLQFSKEGYETATLDIVLVEGFNELNVQMIPITAVEETLIAYGGAVVVAWRDFPISYRTVHDLVSGDHVGPSGYIGQWRDEYGWLISRGFVSFDTRHIAPGKVISAVLQIYGTRDLSATDFNVVVQKGSYDHPKTAPTKADFNYRYYSGDGGRLPTASFKTGAYNNIELNANGISWIGWMSGWTSLAIRSSRDIAARAPSGDEAVEVELGPTLFHPPRLIIKYQK